MSEPYRISRLLGVDSYPSRAVAAVIWPRAVCPPVPCGLDGLTFVIDRAFGLREEDPRTVASAR